MGKAAGADLIEGKLTLPLILLLESKPDLADQLEIVMIDGSYEGVSREKLLRALESTGALDSARGTARDFALAARKNLEVLPETEYREALGDLPAFVIDRDR
jgi:octaprenyl-diphosphate synthase